MKLTQLAFLIGALALASGCSSSSSSVGGTGGSHSVHPGNNNDAAAPTGDAATSTPSPSTATAHINAAAGGEVSLSDGAGVVIPPGALNATTDITITSRMPASSLPDQASLQGLTYDFGPNGTTFNDPVSLTLPLVGTPGANEQAVVSWLNTDTNKWEDLTTTTGQDGTVSAETTHFTLFIVRFAGVPEGAFTCDFAACTGGNIVGAWNILGVCIDVPAGDNAITDTCPDATVDLGLDLTGNVTFDNAGGYMITTTTGTTFTFTMPASCLVGVTDTCVGLFGSDSADAGSVTTCTGDPATTGCSCSQTSVGETKNETGTYSITGSQISMQGTTDTAPETSDLCISGDSLKVQVVEAGDDGGAPTTYVWAAQRQ